MSLKTARLTLDNNSMPQHYKDLGIRFVRETVAGNKGGSTEMVLVRPAASLLPEEEALGPEGSFYLLACGLHLKASDGTTAQGSGQLLITGRRLIGMLTNGSATGSNPLSATTGNVFCFSLNRDDVLPPEVKTRRLKPSEYTFRSRDGLAVQFQLLVFAAMAAIANGKTILWYDKNMNFALSPEGQERLLNS